MSDYFRIVGGQKLSGTVEISGSKNAAFPILAASLLLSQPVCINNVPAIEDVDLFIRILEDLGVEITYLGPNSVIINPLTISHSSVSHELSSKIRGSYYFLGALLARHNEASTSFPGGCNIGDRPMDLHFAALSNFGVTFSISGERILAYRNREGLGGDIEIVLPFPSRGATINSILTAALQDGVTTRIHNYNESPETECLLNFLGQAGLVCEKNEGVLWVHGTSSLALNTFAIIPDKIEAATFLAAGLLTRSTVSVSNILIDHLQPFLDKLTAIGVKYHIDRAHCISTWLPPGQTLKPVSVVSGLVHPKIDADFEPLLVALLTMAEGESYVEDAINPERHLRFMPQLIQMGANIELLDSTRAVVQGPTNFLPAEVECNEIRGGVAMTLAALSAEGVSIIKNVRQIDRGYETIEKKLAQLGARIERVVDSQ